jgi:glutathione S-transferase
MAQLKLVIANKNISSWSLRPWLLCKEAGIPFEEELVQFGAADWKSRVTSPSGRVPFLVSEGLVIWDSLAIAEHLNELFPEKHLWPVDAQVRAIARSVSSEMHSGFPDLRRECSMNVTLRTGRALSAGAAHDVRRAEALFNECREKYGKSGPFLFGTFSIADAMFAPVASRARTYDLKLSPVAQAYLDTLWNLPAMKEWVASAKAEVDAGIADPVPHGPLFSRSEAEKFAREWIERLNAKQLDALARLCSKDAQGRTQGGRAPMREALQTGGDELVYGSCAWDGDANRLTILSSRGRAGEKRDAQVLSFDSFGLVASMERY